MPAIFLTKSPRPQPVYSTFVLPYPKPPFPIGVNVFQTETFDFEAVFRFGPSPRETSPDRLLYTLDAVRCAVLFA